MHGKTRCGRMPVWVYIGRGTIVWICVVGLLTATPVIPAVIMLATDHPQTSEWIVRTLQTNVLVTLVLSIGVVALLSVLCVAIARVGRAFARH